MHSFGMSNVYEKNYKAHLEIISSSYDIPEPALHKMTRDFHRR